MEIKIHVQSKFNSSNTFRTMKFYFETGVVRADEV